jgi:putative transposase
MKRHTAEEVITKLRQAEADLAQGLSLAQVCQRLGVSEPTLHRWRNQYGGLKGDEAKRLKELEAENARLKRLVADCPGRAWRRCTSSRARLGRMGTRSRSTARCGTSC